ncbi:DUF1993 domain-containing protein [Azohydromonas lata]|uniref:DUF1993 domain-containing protein n=1 Tax=Azohydromonas lata TaxID=45677 RepID=UPI0008348AC6|nr:DUF1993 domain-containing protein [Azohydromonas lata]
MTMSMYGASAPVFERMLDNLLTWLVKAQAHAESRRFDSANYLGMRLAPDMLTFASQVRIAADVAKLAVARLAGVDAPRFPDDETTLEALAQRVRNTLAFVRSIDPRSIEGSDAREIVLPQRSAESLHFTGETFLQRWALPNFFFHATTTYALLRHAGVDLGKADYLGL